MYIITVTSTLAHTGVRQTADSGEEVLKHWVNNTQQLTDRLERTYNESLMLVKQALGAQYSSTGCSLIDISLIF